MPSHTSDLSAGRQEDHIFVSLLTALLPERGMDRIRGNHYSRSYEQNARRPTRRRDSMPVQRGIFRRCILTVAWTRFRALQCDARIALSPINEYRGE